MNKAPEKSSNTYGSLLRHATGVSLLCFVAIVAQSAGLVSVVKYVTSREGWEAQKQQYSAVISEWEEMAIATNAKIEEQKKREFSAEQQRIAAEKELERTLENLTQAKGELDAIELASQSALEVQRRSQAEEQVTLANIQVLKKEMAELSKKKAELEFNIAETEKEFSEVEGRVTANQATIVSQNRELISSNQKLSLIDASLKSARDELRRTSDELMKANEDLAVALAAKKNAIAATESATTLKSEVENLNSQKAKLSGEIDALTRQKLDLEKEIATSDSRMSVARSKLADYLEKWNNRDNLSREIDELMDRVKKLKQTENDTVSNIAKMNDQAVKLETRVKILSDEVKASEAQLKELKDKQKELLESLMELQRLKKQAEEQPAPPNAD